MDLVRRAICDTAAFSQLMRANKSIWQMTEHLPSLPTPEPLPRWKSSKSFVTLRETTCPCTRLSRAATLTESINTLRRKLFYYAFAPHPLEVAAEGKCQ
jgi:hypothetical protein